MKNPLWYRALQPESRRLQQQENRIRRGEKWTIRLELNDATVLSRKLTRWWSLRYVSATMPKYLARKCPRCRDYFGVVVSQEPQSNGEHPIAAFCALCGYQLKGWRLIVGRKQSDPINVSWKLKATR